MGSNPVSRTRNRHPLAGCLFLVKMREGTHDLQVRSTFDPPEALRAQRGTGRGFESRQPYQEQAPPCGVPVFGIDERKGTHDLQVRSTFNPPEALRAQRGTGRGFESRQPYQKFVAPSGATSFCILGMDSNPRALGKAPGAPCNPRWPAPQGRSNPVLSILTGEMNYGNPRPPGAKHVRSAGGKRMPPIPRAGRKRFLLPPPGARGIIVPIKRRSPAAISPRAAEQFAGTDAGMRRER